MARQRPGQQAGLWLAVGGVAAITPLVMNLAADRFGDRLPGLRTYNNYVTRRNG